MSRVGKAIAAAIGPLFLAGCMVFPWYEPAHFGRDDGPDRELVVGRTTIDEVVFALGAPTRYRGNLLVYSAARTRGVGAVWPGFGVEMKQVQMLWLEFDALERLAHREIRSGEICADGDYEDTCRFVPVPAPDRLSHESRAFATRPGTCSLYLYSDTWLSGGGPVWTVGGTLLGPAGENQFLHLQARPGKYLVHTHRWPGAGPRTSAGQLEVDCPDGGLEFVYSRPFSGRLERVDPAEAREALASRRLALDAAGGRLR